MKNVVKQILGSVALSAMALSMIGTDGALAKGTSATIPVELPSVDKGKSATIPVELPTVAGPASERGIKDQGVRSCNGCGLTGREAAAPPGTDPAAQGAARTGRPKERDDTPRDTSATAGQAPNGQGGTQPSTAKPKKKGPKVRDDSVYSTPLRLSVVGGVADYRDRLVSS